MRNNSGAIIGGAVILALFAIGGQQTKTAAPSPAPAQPAAAATLIDIGGEWCGVCVSQKPIVKQLEASGVAIEHLDPLSKDKNEAAAAKQWRAPDCPTYIAVRDGREVGRIVGKTSLSALKQLLSRRAPDHDEQSVCLADIVVPAATDGIASGPGGWRLRLFYPPDSREGAAAKAMIEGMPAIVAKYGFEAATTDSPMFRSWQSAKLPSDQITLLLVKADDRVVYFEHKIAKQAVELREAIRAAARGSWEK